MKVNKLALVIVTLGLFFVSCSKDDDVTEEVQQRDLTVERFIYRGMNDYYLYKAEVPQLADDYYSNLTRRNEFMNNFKKPEDFYEGVQASHDKFSFMTDDYVALENMFKGVRKSNGMNYSLGTIGDTEDVFGIVRYVLPNSSAANEGLKRGDAFMEIDGTRLNTSNYRDLLGRDSYSLRIAEITNDGNSNSISSTDKIVNLLKTETSENPVLISKVIETEGRKIGYVMYNSFTRDFGAKLNEVFGELKAQAITHLVLDLRYNGGGDVETATDLASMITGQFEGKIFAQEQWNEKWQKFYEEHYPQYLINRFDSQIVTEEPTNYLGLTKLYVLTTGSSASASELIINGLDPHIQVVQIGTVTAGKFQGSITRYDSDNFRRNGANLNPSHTYAIQPLVLKMSNSEGRSDYGEGFTPQIHYREVLSNYGELGDPSEPMLKAAINDILGKPQEEVSAQTKRAEGKFKYIGESNMFSPIYQRMYKQELPAFQKEDL